MASNKKNIKKKVSAAKAGSPTKTKKKAAPKTKATKKKITKKTIPSPTPSADLHNTAPREQAGAGSGAAFEFQYRHAALKCLELLDANGPVTIYCEWHDDFVSELGGTATIYGYHQVKSVTTSDNNWTFNKTFGLGRGKTLNEKSLTDSVMFKLLDHHFKFGDKCGRVELITNGVFAEELVEFVDALDSVSSASALTGLARDGFKKISTIYQQYYSNLTDQILFEFLKKIRLTTDPMPVVEANEYYNGVLGQRIRKYSEVDLKISEAEHIGQNLVDQVRVKSHCVLKKKLNTPELKKLKAIQTEDLLNELPLSSEAYTILKSGGDPSSILTLSRLHRLISSDGDDENLISDFCRLKIQWDNWIRVKRHFFSELEYIRLKNDCSKLLKQHATKVIDFEGLLNEVRNLEGKWLTKLASSISIDASLILGFIFAIASKSKAGTL